MPTPSPNRPSPSSELDFGDALRDVARGCKITRREWNNGDRVFLQGGFLHISIAEDGETTKKGVHRFVVSEGDIVAQDWVVVR